MTQRATAVRATFVHALRSEWTKLFSLRSTAYTLVTFVILAVGLIVLIGYGTADDYHRASAADQAEFAPMEVSLLSLNVAWLAIMVLGVLLVTGEYATGMIRPSLAAVPRRGRLLTAKAAVFTAVVLVVGTVTGFTVFLVSQSILASRDVPYVTLGDPHVLRAVFGVGLFVTLIGLTSVAVGAILRATAGGIAAMVVGAFILPNLAGLLPDWWAEQVQKFYPTLAGSQLMALERADGALAPWAGFAVMCGFTAALLALAFALFQRRDA
jgi:ABC-2 type transport system permease protein